MELAAASALDVADALLAERECTASVVVRIGDVSDTSAMERVDEECCVLEAGAEVPPVVVVSSTVENLV